VRSPLQWPIEKQVASPPPAVARPHIPFEDATTMRDAYKQVGSKAAVDDAGLPALARAEIAVTECARQL
jgi:hypothetical protein